ncbi:exosortase, partial [Roseomonas alkaliterrae]
MTDLRRAVASGEIAASEATPGPSAWRLPLILLATGLAAWGAIFAAEAVHAVRIWESSAAYNHGWLILPIALWLAWERRHRLALLRPVPAPALALLGLPAAAAWFIAERLGVMEGRQFAALGVVYALVLGTLGWRVALAMAAPLAYLVFLVPFGAFTVPMLQSVTAHMVDIGLDFTGIPHYVDDLLIEIPAGSFYVAEACAGLRFIIAALAFGALYAFVMFRSPWRRLIVMVLALVVPVIANGVRAFGLVVLGHIEGSAAAVEADHVLYGWGFFSIVLLLLIAAGLPFREDRGRPPVLSGPGEPPARAPLLAAIA